MPIKFNSRPCAAMPLVLTLLLAACASNSPSSPPLRVEPPAIPPLPAQARQPESSCSPTCSATWSRLVEQWQQKLMPPAQPGNSAPRPTKP